MRFVRYRATQLAVWPNELPQLIPTKKKKKKRKKPKKEKEEAEKEKGKGRIRDSPTTRINPSPTRIPVIFKSRVAEQRLITGAEGKAKFFGPERGIRRDKAGSRHLCTIRNRKARKRKCVYFRGIIKRVVQRPWRTPVDRTKVGNNVSDTTLVWLCPEERLRSTPLSRPLALSHPFRPPTLSSPDLHQPTLIRVSAADSDS